MIHHGQRITAADVAQFTSSWSSQDFTSLCNAIAWATASKHISTLPSFTERANVKDDGADAEWVLIPKETTGSSSRFLAQGWNILQYKLRDTFAQPRNKLVANLGTNLKGALKDLFERHSQHASKYVLFTNIDLTSAQKTSLRSRILEGYDDSERVQVDIVGAAELAAALNDLPHIRSAYFSTSEFQTWNEAWAKHTVQSILQRKVDLVGRDAILQRLRALVQDPTTRSIVLSGPHNIGKSRLALDATIDQPINTVVALDGQNITVADLLKIETPGLETIVIVEDPNRDGADALVGQSLARSGLKLILTLPTTEDAPRPNFGSDERIQVLQLDPLNDIQARQLIRTAGAILDFGIESWIVEQSGGNPGVLLLAASLGTELRRSAASFREHVARTFEQKIRRELGSEAISVLQVLSVLENVGVTGNAARELDSVCRVLGDGLTVHNVLGWLHRLQQAGLVRIAGAYAEVLPPAFATYLADLAFEGRYDILQVMFAVLDRSGRLRLIRRIRNVPRGEIAEFWSQLFSDSGPFSNLQAALSDAYLLRLVSGAIPAQVSELIDNGLQSMSLQDRVSISGDARRELVWTIEELLFRRQTSAVGLRCLLLLADAETEEYGNNATGLFCQCFSPRHPQFPMGLSERLAFLHSLLEEQQPQQRKALAIRAIQHGLNPYGSSFLQEGSGPEPLDTRPDMTWGMIFDYVASLVDLLMEAALEAEDSIASQARVALPTVISHAASIMRLEEAIERMRSLTDWSLTRAVPISVPELSQALIQVRDNLTRLAADETRMDTETLHDSAQEIAGLISRLESGDFAVRLKRWAGTWAVDENTAQLQELAREAAEQSDLLNDEVLAWLLSDEAKLAYRFFEELGKVDTNQTYLATIESLGSREDGAQLFQTYFGGMYQVNPAATNARLDHLLEEGRVTGAAIVRASMHLVPDSSAIHRIDVLLHENRVDPLLVERALLRGIWFEGLVPEGYAELLKLIAGPAVTNAMCVIDSISLWIYGKRALNSESVELAWRCLEVAAPAAAQDYYACDQVAARLTTSDPDRGFTLFEYLLRDVGSASHWHPIAPYTPREFWAALCEANRVRAMQLALSASLSEGAASFDLRVGLVEVTDQVQDKDTLLDFARQSEQHALVVCRSAVAAKQGFWPLALEILQMYPQDVSIRDALEAAARRENVLISIGTLGSWSQSLARIADEIQTVLNDAATPILVHDWLKRVQRALRKDAERAREMESGLQTSQQASVPDVPNAPERIWAIKGLLAAGKLDEARGLISQNEALELLPTLGLTEDRMMRWRSIIETWPD